MFRYIHVLSMLSIFPGSITTTSDLDREAADEYELVVEAIMPADRVRNSAQTLVKVMVEDINDEAPVLTHPVGGVIYIRPGTAAGSLVATLAARDPDRGDDRVTFERVSGPVSVDRWSGG